MQRNPIIGKLLESNEVPIVAAAYILELEDALHHATLCFEPKCTQCSKWARRCEAE